MKKIKTTKFFLLGLLAGGLLMGMLAFTGHIDGNLAVVNNGRIQYQWYPPKTPQNMTFAGERVPMTIPYVRETMDKQLISNAFYHSHTLYILKLKTRIFPTIERILKENGVPEDFKYLCVAESSLENPTSSAGARGYWQFMTETAKRFGLEVDSEVDERYDLEKATLAACQYLKSAYNTLGSWTAAAASYNCGVAGYSRRAAAQGTANYYDLLLPEETNNYIFRILALKEIIGQPETYGFHIPKEDEYKPVPTRVIAVTNSIPNLAAFAQENGTNLRMLKYLNPWLRGESLTISKENAYTIKLPQS